MCTIQLSHHFSLSEFTQSNTARARGIDNTPSLAVVSNLQQLCIHVLEPLRMHVGGPIRINSGYRCPALNRAVGGVANSQHLTGEAADIHIPSKETGRKWMKWIIATLPFDQLIWEQGWIHVSFRQDGKNRGQVIE